MPSHWNSGGRLVAVLVVGLVSNFAWSAEETSEEKAKGRLPAYFKEVIDAPQRDKIYTLQADYAAKISPLQEQIKKLVAERDAAIEKVLTAEQQEKLKKIRDAAAVKRKPTGLGPASPQKPAEKPAVK